LQKELWRLLPDGRGEGPRLGAFRDADGGERYSHPLALSQLLITHYLLNAALGAHAI
jgi:phosphoribulokinase